MQGLHKEQLDFVKRLCYVTPNTPIDLEAFGNPTTLLIEVKTTTRDKDITSINVNGRYLYKALPHNLIPTLAAVKATIEGDDIRLPIKRYMIR